MEDKLRDKLASWQALSLELRQVHKKVLDMQDGGYRLADFLDADWEECPVAWKVRCLPSFIADVYLGIEREILELGNEEVKQALLKGVDIRTLPAKARKAGQEEVLPF